MKITILGSGTCVPRLERSACAVLVETGQQKILLDLGPGTMRRLLETGVTIFDLTHVFISHFHPDHTAELAPLIFATKYPDISRRTRLLTVFGGTGLKKFYEGLQAAYGDWIVLPQDQLAVREIDTPAGEVFRLDRTKIT
ncbi:MAG: ribonuclease Z, partial [Desulfosarcinaceae bacterium]